MPKNQDLLDEWKEKALPSEKITPTFLQAIFVQGAILSVLIALFLIVYYM